MQPCRLLLLSGLALLMLLSPAASDDFTCTSDRQVVNCGQLPVDTAEQQAEYIACCRANLLAPAVAAEEVRVAAAAASVRQALQPAAMRPDLDPNGPLNATVNFRWGLCHTRRRAIIPTFSGTSWTSTRQTVRVCQQPLVQDSGSSPDLATPATLVTAADTMHHSSK
jgi:hypothetical protein